MGRLLITFLIAGVVIMLLLSSADFISKEFPKCLEADFYINNFKINFFKKNLSGTLSECLNGLDQDQDPHSEKRQQTPTKAFKITQHVTGLKLRVHTKKMISLLLNQNICCGYSKD